MIYLIYVLSFIKQYRNNPINTYLAITRKHICYKLKLSDTSIINVRRPTLKSLVFLAHAQNLNFEHLGHRSNSGPFIWKDL